MTPKMSYCLKLLLLLLLLVRQEAELAFSFRRFVYQKDMSEYCRRRVMPSVFLGRQVVDAYSQRLHFSQLELPYSCFVSIRTESGSNIILVVQLASEKSVIESCRASKNQLLVYGIGETFGGYWGALPDNVMKPVKPETPPDEARYTLKTTQPTTTTTTTKRTTRPTTTPSTTKDLEEELRKATSEQNDLVVEVPLVNVSAVLVPGDLPRFALFDAEESFDSVIDVKPQPGVRYKTTVLPLVQFAMSDEGKKSLRGDEGGERGDEGGEPVAPRYELDFSGDWFTPDARLSYPMLRLPTRSKPGAKHKYNVNHRLDFRKNKKLFAEKERARSLLQKETQHMDNPYGIVDAILKNLSKIKDEGPKTNMEIDKDVANLLQGLANIGHKHNESVVLVPNESWYTRRPVSTSRLISTRYRTDSITWRQPSASYRTNYLEEEDTSNEDEGKSSNTMQAVDDHDPVVIDVGRSGPLLPLELDVDRVILDVTQPAINIRKSKIIDPNALVSQVSDTSTTATPTTLTAISYLEDEEDTSTEEGLSAEDDKLSNKVLAINNNDPEMIDVRRIGPLLPLDLDVDRVLLNGTQQTINTEESIITDPQTSAPEVTGITSVSPTVETMKPMTLVDHESWENMVQAASLMAVVLNQSVTPSVHEEKHGLNVTPSNNVKGRRKRFVHAIPIELAKPHHLPLKVEVSSSTEHSDKISDAQEFQRLIELQDDEIHDRVALRYLRQYVGPALFNICAFDTVEPAAKYTILFNSSRLVLAITNFTLDSMSVVMTPARTLLRADSRCAPEHLECQVLGARVCIDSLNACDGVANCGSYDVYDEDRLMCGASAGLQHNVCLAAFTFLAVLLTMLYTIHYWLKRCVPKVSDAFFIYTDAAENVLFLDPIMRSPHDMDDPKEILRGAAMNEYMECTEMPIQEKRSSIFTRWVRRFKCKRKDKQSSITSDPIVEEGFGQMEVRNQRCFSFAEVELRKMATPFLVEAAVQTGSSLEMQFTDKPITKERMTQFDSNSDIVAHYEGKRQSTKISVLDVESIGKEPSDELSILNFFKRARSVSMQIPLVPPVGKHEAQHKQPLNTQEKEVQCFEYDHSHISPEIVSVLETIGEISGVKPEIELVRKRIRFEEQRSRQPSDDDDVDEEAATDSRLRRSALYGATKQVHSEDTDADSYFDEPSTSTGNREFKSYFWGGGKNKPKKPTTKKKKQQSTLR